MGKSGVRPLIAFSIVQLEEAFEAAVLARDDRKVREVAGELECRSVPKAKKLLRRVSDHLAAKRKPRQVARTQAAAEAPGSDQAQAIARKPKARAGRKAPADATIVAAAPASTSPEPDFGPPEPQRELSSSRTSRPPWRQEPASDILQAPALDRAQARRVLDAWMLAEILVPYGRYGAPADLAEGSGMDIADFAATSEPPWLSAEDGHKRGGLFYQVVVGAIRLEGAAVPLFELYGDTKIEGAAPSGFAPIAILTLDRDGRPVARGALAISSFAWGLPFALKQDFASLGRWTETRRGLIEEIEGLLRPAGALALPGPVTAAQLRNLFERLAERLGLPAELLVAPHFALRVARAWRGEAPPESPVVESPHLADLLAAQQKVASGRCHETLARYLGLRVPTRRIDLRGNDIALADAIAPARIPPGKWPSGVDRPLVLLQQAAVNLALDQGEASGLLPINGPVGTGKEALLRDLVAGLVIDRAERMAGIANPREVFSHIGKVRTADGFTDRYAINEALKGSEILVVSSREALATLLSDLTGLAAVDVTRPDLRYFGTVADRLVHGASKGPQAWGLLVAPLGSGADLARLGGAIWDDEEHGLKSYLLEAAGNQPVADTNAKGGKAGQSRKPAVVAAHNPPQKAEALQRWQEAQRLFRAKATDIRARLEMLERGRQALAERAEAENQDGLQAQLASAEEVAREAQALLAELGAQVEAGRNTLAEAQRALDHHIAGKPSLLSRLIGSKHPPMWNETKAQREHEREILSEGLAALEARFEATQSRHDEALALMASLRQIATQVEARKRDMAEAIDAAIALSAHHFVDAAFFDRSDAEVQRDTPWMSAEINRLREDLFAAAMTLHRAFVDAAAKPIGSNLDLLFRCFSGNAEWTEKMHPLMPDLWATLSCVVPVIATSFDAIEPWFGDAGPAAFGWLVIDGAGKLAPQQAVGALSRAKHAVVIGDPMQLASVSCLSPGLAKAIAGYFDIDAERFMAPSASVQTLAGAASVFGNTLALDGAWKRQARKASPGSSSQADRSQGLSSASDTPAAR